MINFQKEIASLLYPTLTDWMGPKFGDTDIVRFSLKVPQKEEFGDWAFPCFPLAKELKKSPQQIANNLAEIVKKEVSKGSGIIQDIRPEGGYVNFIVDPIAITDTVLSETLSAQGDYGRNSRGNEKLVVIDYSAPNLGKPMHVGHIRSTIVGDSLIKILNFNGYKTHGINYLGDIGLHMGKLIAAYNLWGSDDKLRTNPDKEMLGLYVRFESESKNNSLLYAQARAALEKLENKDPDYVKVWAIIQELSMTSFNRAYGLLDTTFDEITGQSNFSEKGKELVLRGVSKGIVLKKPVSLDESLAGMERDEEISDAFVVPLRDFGLPDKVVLRGDGTALYSTQDLGAAVSRYDQFKFDKMLYVIATEQNTYMQQIFKILELFGYGWAKDCHHVAFGMINLENGKMSSREGNVIYLEELLERSVDIARKKLSERELPQEEINNIAKSVGIGAVKYNILSIDPVKDITFSSDRALDFEGNSAPYIQYSYVRAMSLLEKTGQPKSFNPNNLRSPEELRLIKRIYNFPEIVERSANSFKPHLIANYLFELASSFTDFYQKVRIINTPEQDSRLALAYAAKTTIGNGLSLLGIKTPMRM
jgi:arginyl-tRNA synthetase